MHKFKTIWCLYGFQHDWFSCAFTHTYQDSRRLPQVGYGSEPCALWKKEFSSADYARCCPHGTLRLNAHRSIEQLYHPAHYKTLACSDFHAHDHRELSRPRGVLCAFYHENSERRRPFRAIVELSNSLPPQQHALLQAEFLKPPFFALDDFKLLAQQANKQNCKSPSS